jgi:hypothetical protein
MKQTSLILLSGVLCLGTPPAEGQTRLRLSAIIPGTENVQLVANGDFQAQGTVTVTNTHPYPTGWTRTADMFADAGTNMVAANSGVVARALASGGAAVCQFQRAIVLQPATDYILSAYLWNLGDAANHVTTVIDTSDVAGEPQITLSYSDTNADLGYFVYRSFNTATTGTNLTLRVFYDSRIGTGAASKYFPAAAQWDNVAITPAAVFAAPAPSGSGTNPYPVVPALRIFPAGGNFALYWPTSCTAVSLQCAGSLRSPDWQIVTNVPAIVSNQFTVTLPNAAAARFFTLALTVDPNTLTGKLLMGYQGWFACPGDGSAQNSWVHWFFNNTPTAANAHFDFWPDTSELDPEELFSTGMTYSNGAPAKLYSAYQQKTVVRHFKWMQDYHLDGVFFQRFLSDLPGGNLSALRNQVAVNVRVGAETYGRVFAVMYDISGYATNTLVSKLTNDWLYLVNTQRVTSSSAYLRHRGKPVVAIWGFGFSGRADTAQQAQQAIDWFKAAGCTVMGGLPTHWRDLNGDAQTNAAWATAFRSFDVISPWAVGRYGDNTGADSFRLNQIVPDLVDCSNHGIDYMPVIFPGFSWANLQDNGLYNQTPRNGGNFYWRQAYNAVLSHCTMIYGAMFDEVDEGTAMYKLVPTAGQLPAQGTFVPLDIDHYNLPSDWYLRLADQAGRMLRGEIPLQPQIPISP